MYYADNFNSFKEVVFDFSESDSQSIQDCQSLLKNPKIEQNLAFLKANYNCVSGAIKKLETGGLTLVEALDVVHNFQSAISSVPGPIGKKVLTKLESVLTKNTGLKVLEQVSKILCGEIVESLEMQESLLPKFKFAPITSVDVERSFSRFKNILSDRRRSFSVQTLEKHLIIACFKNESDCN